MKRTIDNFFVKLRPDPSKIHSLCSDTEPSTSQVMSNPGLETASENEPHKIDSEPEPTESKRGKMYKFQRDVPSPHRVNRSLEEAGMMIKFNIAYNIAKEVLFTKFKSEIILHKKNGLNVNPTYSNDVAYAHFIGVIADTLKKKMSVEIANSAYMAFLIDGDTDIATKECVIVYARILQKGRPANILIGHTEVEHAHAQGLHAASKEAFAPLGDQCSNWLEKIIALGADGAAVNLGSQGGVIALLQQEADDHIGTRWLPHVSRAVETFLKPGQFTAVYHHTDYLAGFSANADIAGRATKFNATFVAFCHFIADVFSGISKFSLLLQRNDIILPQAICSLEQLLVTTEIMFLNDMRLQRRQQHEEGEMAIYKFNSIQFNFIYIAPNHNNRDGVAATKLKKVMDATIKSTVKNIKARFSSLLEESASESATTKAVKCFNIFNHDSCPENQEDLVDHGADDLAFLLDHFSTVLKRNGVNAELVKEEFVSLKLLTARMFSELMLSREPYCSEYKILHLVHIMLALPVSASVCERGTSLHSETEDDLIRISVEGPSLEDYEARESVASWFTQGERSRRPNYRSWGI
ncbi:protein unc-79 [Sarotherodon galilaeus]